MLTAAVLATALTARQDAPPTGTAAVDAAIRLEPLVQAGSVVSAAGDTGGLPGADGSLDPAAGTEPQADPAAGTDPVPIPDPEPITDPDADTGTPAAAPLPVRDPRSWPAAPTYKPAGKASSFVLTQGRPGVSYHWDYCKPFTYLVNPRRMPPALRADVRKAVARFSAASGMQFRYGGQTDSLPSLGARLTATAPPNARQADQTIIIAVSDERSFPILRGAVAAIGGQTAWGDPSESYMAYMSGGVVLDAEDLHTLRRGFGPLSYGALLLHELGHVAGLAHVDDSTQVMYPVMSHDLPGRYGAGDLAGLAKLSDMGCFPPADR